MNLYKGTIDGKLNQPFYAAAESMEEAIDIIAKHYDGLTYGERKYITSITLVDTNIAIKN